ncbi:MAG: Omp28-related outer membrane protein [Bacteroidota bacterium]
MKKIISFVLSIIVISIFSCDKIDGPTRESISVDTTCHFDVDNSAAVKKVLVEDYTGHNCGNCPEGGVILNDSMHNKYGDNLVVITVHAGDYANVCPGMNTCPPNSPAGSFAVDYKTTVGTDWHNAYGVFFYPAGMVDRIDYPTSDHLKPKESWDQEAQARLNMSPKARIRIQNSFNDSDKKLRACIETKFLEELTGDYKLSVVITEDSVIDWQVWYGHPIELVPDYVHHHILRTALNTSFGVSVASGTTPINTTVVSGYSFTLDPSWNPDHCAVVAFVYNATTREVLQVEEMKIK